MITNQPETKSKFFELEEVRVIDGDTIQARIPLAFGQSLTARIRLKGWWAAELHGPSAAEGEAAKVASENWFRGREVFLFCPTHRIDLHGRVVGHLWWNGSIIPGERVLGALQLTEARHSMAKRVEASTVTAPPMRPYRDITDEEVIDMCRLAVGTGNSHAFALMREAEERGLDSSFLAVPAKPPGTGSESGSPSLT
jgi:hypothetical protein